jgi:hypothetical protein
MSLSKPRHPLPIDTVVEANRPQCPCKGASFVKISGKIKKVIPNHSGTWYYLDTGSTINGTWIISINGQPL